MGADLKELLLFIAKSLADKPDDVFVDEVEKEDMTVLELRVAKEDMGKIIGRGGRVARDIRSIVRAASRDMKKIHVEILETE